ncbi:sugar ABC transporter ATP-binding protein [Bradyrhizobium sp. U87765 SZCCT0131]|uniref:sugar ABC transporter ATP-binding protein n=1 Tax=unclassified Bradyrhizobium TaxID=2631580 RepID=UPI001BAE01BD|nr:MULTISPECIES: sugar ABC transporter ATP-binding protein [unclassified Bradyrhizobium]MBR1221616.1 sugar ABC transporter ATP-binding protein [Bradyrhizobium sp. U87765 SZCCT0131]MBR1264461.1 sugar ABC transporter ATP-binding protein [Bradyrhizobium sp. U87765 SZCCT0134]MBR1304632.1 sugar ABC transporter ATP-binding protein [Bradyrhizobium sp. U87765 SZCCT0110]MBR1322511.1 sugar ABC transporter ATP-binding protein [Bradyrhizobium sp. U87765 SZCCT0109]MBR1346561.1 sugar ABC transporter ATP-bin
MTEVISAAAPRAAGQAAPLFELRGISKEFPGVKALDDVSFAVWPGEVHMLLGENGAGKSSLMKVLCGAYRADRGEFYANGDKVEINSAADAQRLGIAVIFQEFSLVPYLNIAQNIFLGREPAGPLPGTIDRRRILSDAKRILDMVGFDIDPSTKVEKLGVAQQQMVEIAKAISQNARILVMDEPTAALSDRESELLFALIARLKADGVAIIYISHRMAEVFAMGDRITVLRDGRRIDEVLPGEASPDQLVRMMVGRNVDMSYPRNFATEPGRVVLEVKNLSASTGISDINLTVRAGEIVGLCGLVGAGRTEVVRAIFGADKASAGEIIFEGKAKSGGPDEASRLGLALIPESRKTEGLALLRSVGDNLVVAAMRKLFPSGLFDRGAASRTADGLVQQLRIATPGAKQAVGLLSGGNQQKVVIGKWLAAGAKLFIFDEPTRGIDVGAKSEIFALIDRLVAEGAAALMISSEQAEICHVCDRAYVMRDGRIAGELSRAELTEENIVRLGMHHA